MTAESELFDGIFSGVDISMDGSKTTDEELTCYLGGGELHMQTSNVVKDATDCNRSTASSRCMSRNAVVARENRQKKKEYIQNLEKTVENLRTQNDGLTEKSEKMQTRIESLLTEVDYLKGVIANQSTLSRLIGSMCQTPGVKFYSSFAIDREQFKENERHSANNKRKFVDSGLDNQGKDNLESKTKRISIQLSENLCELPCHGNSKQQTEEANINKGVCLHVSGEDVSLEFCSNCSNSALHTRKAAKSSASKILKEKVSKRKK